MAMIKIEHIQGGVTTEIPERDLPQYVRLGWRRYVEPQPEPAPAESDSAESDSVEESKPAKRAKKSA